MKLLNSCDFFYTPIFQASEQGRACLPLSPWLLLLSLLTSIVANYARNNGWKYDISSSEFCCCRDDPLLHLAPCLSRYKLTGLRILTWAVGVVAPFSQFLRFFMCKTATFKYQMLKSLIILKRRKKGLKWLWSWIWDYEISWKPLFHLNMVKCCSYTTLPSMWPLTFGIWPLLFLTQSPPKGATIQYRPKPVVPPVIFAGGQAYTVPGQMQGVQATEVRQWARS